MKLLSMNLCRSCNEAFVDMQKRKKRELGTCALVFFYLAWIACATRTQAIRNTSTDAALFIGSSNGVLEELADKPFWPEGHTSLLHLTQTSMEEYTNPGILLELHRFRNGPEPAIEPQEEERDHEDGPSTLVRFTIARRKQPSFVFVLVYKERARVPHKIAVGFYCGYAPTHTTRS